MGKKIETYQSDDGRLFLTELDMVTHEVRTNLTRDFPDLKVQISYIIANVSGIAAALAPLYALNEGTTSGSHTPACKGPIPVSAAGQPFPPRPVATQTCRYAHPPGSRCPACANVPRDVTVIPAKESKGPAETGDREELIRV